MLFHGFHANRDVLFTSGRFPRKCRLFRRKYLQCPTLPSSTPLPRPQKDVRLSFVWKSFLKKPRHFAYFAKFRLSTFRRTIRSFLSAPSVSPLCGLCVTLPLSPCLLPADSKASSRMFG